MALYLNYFDFLHNAVGIKTAANTYFNKEPKDLTALRGGYAYRTVQESVALQSGTLSGRVLRATQCGARPDERRQDILADSQYSRYAAKDR